MREASNRINGGGSSNLGNSNFNEYMRQIIAANQGMNGGNNRWMPSSSRAQRNEQDNRNMFGKEQEDPKYEQANSWDRLFGGLSELSNKIMEPFDYGKYAQEGNIGATVGSFLGSLPAGILSSFPSGAASLYEAGTGRGATEINDDQIQTNLSDPQKFGAGVSGGIDILGNFFGGTARFLGAGANAVSKAIGHEGTKLGTGLVKRMTGSTLGQIGFDVAEEGAEEAAQSVFGDIRYNQLDEGSFGRAAQAAALGALGGGIMSGSAAGINRLVNGPSTENGSVADNARKDIPETDPTNFKWLQDTGFEGRQTPTAAAAIKERRSNNNEVPGSGSVTKVAGMSDLNLDQHRMGVNNFRAMYFNNDNGESAEHWQKTLSATGEEIEAALLSDDPAVELNKLVERKSYSGQRATQTVGRNPDTNLGTWDSDLVGFFNGDGVQMSRPTAQIANDDVDGDQLQFYAYGTVPSAGYASEQLLNPATGKSRIDWDYVAFAESSEAINKAKNIMRQSLESHGVEQKAVNSLLKEYNDIMKQGGTKGNGDKLAALFNKVRLTINDAAAKQGNTGTNIGGTEVSMMINDIVSSNQVEYILKNVIESVTDQSLINFEKLSDTKKQRGTQAAEFGDRTRLAQIMYYMGFQVQGTSAKGNPIFRQTGQIHYSTKAMAEVSEYITPETFPEIIAYAMRLRYTGDDPETVISGVFNSCISTEVINRMSGKKIETQADLDTFTDIFVETYNRYAKIFNDASQNTIILGERLPIGISTKDDISKSNPNEVAREFGKTMGGTFIDSVVNITDKSLLFGVTWDQLIERTASGSQLYLNQFNEIPVVNSFFRRLMSDYGGTLRALDSSLKKDMQSEAFKNIHTIMSRVKDGKFDDRDFAEVLYILDYYNNILGGELSLDLGLSSPDTILNTELGRMMFSTNVDDRLNAVLCASMQHQFASVREEYMAYKNTSDIMHLNNAKQLAAQMANVSTVHNLIIDQIVSEDPDFTLLDVLWNPDISFAEKEEGINKYLDANLEIVKTPLLASMLKTDVSTMDISSLSNKRRKGNTSLRSAQQMSYDNCLAQLTELKEKLRIRDINPDRFIAAIKELANKAYVEHSMDIVATMAYDASTFNKADSDKGTAGVSASMNYQQVLLLTEGGALPWVSDLSGGSFGRYSIDQVVGNRNLLLAALFSDDSDMVLSNMSMFDGNCHFNKDKIFSEVSPTYNPDKGITNNDIIALLDAHPQLISWLAPHAIQGNTIDGNATVSSKQGENLSKSLKSLTTLVGEDFNQHNERKHRRIVEQQLLQRPMFYKSVVGAFGSDIDKAMASPEEYRKYYTEAHNKIVDLVYDMVSTPEGGAAMNEHVRRYNESLSKSITDRALRTLQQASDVQVMMQGYEGDINATQRAILQEIVNTETINYVNEELKKIGVNERAQDDILDQDGVLDRSGIVDRIMDKQTRIYAIMCAYNDSLIEVEVAVDGSTRGKIINVLGSAKKNDGSPLTEQEKQRIIDGMDNQFNLWASVLKNTEDMGKYVLNSNDLSLSKNEFMDKAKNVCSYFKFLDEEERAVLKNIDDAFEESDANREQMLRDVMSYCTSKSLSYELREASFGSALDINSDFAISTEETYAFLLEAANDIRAEIGDTIPKRKNATSSWDIPSFDFSNPAASLNASNLLMLAESGSVSSSISIDGGVTKIMQGFGWLKHDTECPVNAKPVPISDIIANPIRYRRCNYKDENGVVGVIGSEQIKNWCNAVNKSQTMIEVYDPEDCANGHCKNHSLGSEARMNSSISYIISELCNYAQEARNLKIKKVLGHVKKIVSRIPKADKAKGSYIEPAAINASDPSGTLIPLLQEYRKEVAKHYSAQFDEAGDSLSLDDVDAMVIAQFTTPVIKLRYTDPSNPNGGTKLTKFVNVKDIYSPDFQASWATYQAEDNLVLSQVAIEAFSLEEISSRITTKVSRKFYQELAATGNEPTVDQIAEWSEEVLNDWSEYKEDGLSASWVLSNVFATSAAMPSNVTVANSPTMMQRWQDRIFGGTNKNLKQLKSKTINDSYLNICKDQTNRLNATDSNGSPIEFIFTQGFSGFNENDPKVKDFKNAIRVSHALNSDGDSVGGIGHAVLSVPASSSDLKAAMRYAYEHRHDLYVPANNDVVRDGLKPADIDLLGTIQINDKAFYKVDVFQKNALESLLSENVTADVVNLPTNRILIAAMTDDTQSNSSTIFDVDCMKAIECPASGDVTKDLTKLLPGSFRRRLATAEDLKKIDFDSNVIYSGYGKESKLTKDTIVSSTKAYLDWIQNSASEGATSRPTFSQGDCIAIIKMDKGGNTVFAPVIVYETVPRNITSARTEQYGDDLVVSYDGIIVPTEGGYYKLALSNESYKTMARGATADELANFPTFWAGLDNQAIRAAMVCDAIAEEGRLFQKTEIMMAQNGWYFSRLVGANILYDSNNLPRQELMTSLEKAAAARGVDATEIFRDLEAGEPNAWYMVRNGEILFAEDPNDEINKILQSMVYECYIHKIPYDVFFNSKQLEDGKWTLRCQDTNWQMVFRLMDQDKILRYFHFLDPSFCPNGTQGTVDKSMVFNRDFQMRRNISGETKGLEEVMWQTVRIAPHKLINDTSEKSTPSSEASFSDQHVNKRAIEGGLVPEYIQQAMSYAAANTNFVINSQKKLDYQKLLDPSNPKYVDIESYGPIRPNHVKVFTPLTINRRHAMAEVASTFDSDIEVREADGTTIDVYNDDSMKKLLEDLKDVLDDRVTQKMAFEFYASQTGYSKIDGSGQNFIYRDQYEVAIKRVIDNIKESGLPVKAGKIIDERVALPLLSENMDQFLWTVESINNRFDSYEDFVQQQIDQMETACRNIQQIKSRMRKTALRRMAAYMYETHNAMSEMNMVNLSADIWIEDWIGEKNIVLQALTGEIGTEMAERAEEAARRTVAIRENFARNAFERSNKAVDSDSSYGGVHYVNRNAGYGSFNKVLNNMADLSMVMSLANPIIGASSIIDRGINQGVMNLMLGFGQKNIGPFAMSNHLNQDIVNGAARDETAMKLWISYSMLGFTGDERQFLANAKGSEEIDEWLKQRHESMGNWGKFQDLVFRMSSGGKVFMDRQIKTFINRFAQLAEKEHHDWWFIKPDGKTTNLELMLRENPARFIATAFGASGGTGDNNIDLDISLQAINFAKRGDMAQKNLVSELYGEICRRMPAARFLVATNCCKFVQYATNKTGRVLNFIAPVSSINYLANKLMAQTDLGQRLNVETLQVNSDLKEALICDALTMSAGMIASLLACLPGVLEPPEDEDKYGNYKEWTIFGLRIGSEWWIEDIIGIAAPMAVFWKTVVSGKPRLDILTDGIAEACWSNPAVRVFDAVSTIIDPDESTVRGYNMDQLDWEKARGGSPSATEVMLADAASYGINWVSQFITPSFAKEVYNDLQQYEVSYKRIYEENGTGQLTEDGMAGATQRTDYIDAMVRKATRKNPLMGFLLDVITQPNTGYMWHEMPRTVYYDPTQLESVREFSIYNDDGTEKTAEEKDAIALSVISVLQGYDDMEALYQTGFYLPYDTRAYVSKVIWDAIELENDQYNECMRETNGFDFYTLGEGDFNVGRIIAQDLKDSHFETVNYWKSLYYDKLWSEPMKRSMATYNRYNTTYAKDDNGEWYATGFKPTIGLPFVMAPGTLSDPGSTMGYENDWATQSIVTGDSTGMRALIATGEDYQQTPDIESWAADGNGNGYSDSYTNRASGNGTDSSKYPRSSGGYSRRSGGGGGKSSPNLYYRQPSINMPSARSANADRLYDTNFDYLRPSFETKGSREAYKREDI